MNRKRKYNCFDQDGLSPFHIACLEHNVEVVSQFLNDKQCDVNQPVAAAVESHLIGQSPLHLALNFYNDDDEARLAVVDLLLKNGAHVNAKDARGETPLHKAVKLKNEERCDILKIILEAGAVVHATVTRGTIHGVTAFDYLLCLGNYSTEDLELFIKHGCRLNAYNPCNEGGYVALAFISRGSHSDAKKILFNAMQKHPHTIEPDDQGRTVIHSLVAHPGTSLYSNEFVKLIDELVEMTGCDIDDRDTKGRTAMFFTTHHGNGPAVEALLTAGADINIPDNDGNLPIGHLIRSEHYKSVSMSRHVRKLELLRLDVSQENRDFARRVQINEMKLKEAIERELELAKSVQVVVPSLTLRDFMYEISPRATAAITGNDAAIHEFFRNFEDDRFEQLQSLIKLQYRKAVARSKLIEPAAVALNAISGCSVLCGELVVRFLTNDDLKHLIDASIL